MEYDLAIIGGGPGGLSAAIYAARFKLGTIVLAREVGGTVLNAHMIENWPGHIGISGSELMQSIREHVDSLNVPIVQSEVTKVEKIPGGFSITSDSKEIESKTVLFATGAKHRKLGIPGEKEFYGRGVSYCAVCDGAFFADKVVAVIGGSDSAAKEALFLSEYAKKVFIIYRREKIRAEPITVERVEANEKIEVINNANVLEVMGDKFVSGVLLDRDYEGLKELAVDGVFVEIGYEAQSELAKELGVELKGNDIIIDPMGRTNVPGAYACGDVTADTFKQAIIAAGQGVNAAYAIYTYLKEVIEHKEGIEH